MMIGRVGRDEDSFNCGGGHGLTQYTAVYNGLTCDFCQAPIVAGSLAMGCRCVCIRNTLFGMYIRVQNKLDNA